MLNIDCLVVEGVCFVCVYIQGIICGLLWMFLYIGCYVSSYQVVWNVVLLLLEELILGDYLCVVGVCIVLVGKIYVMVNLEGMWWFGIDLVSVCGVVFVEVGFEFYDCNDGVYLDDLIFVDKCESVFYIYYLWCFGFIGDNFWYDWVNVVVGVDGEIFSGWWMCYVGLLICLLEVYSEIVYIICCVMDFIDEQGECFWCLYLFYIKLYWFYIVLVLYYVLYCVDQVFLVLCVVFGEESDYLVYCVFCEYCESFNFFCEDVCWQVIFIYMGLICQVDDQFGWFFQYMCVSGCWDDILIVFISDYGDFFGDYGLGEKEFFFELVVGVLLLICDLCFEVDVICGWVEEVLVQFIDVLLSIFEVFVVEFVSYCIEGCLLLFFVYGVLLVDWCCYVIVEYDYVFQVLVWECLG